MFCSFRKSPRKHLFLFQRLFTSLEKDFLKQYDFATNKRILQNATIENKLTPEQERATKLEHESMIKITHQALNEPILERFNSRDFKLALNYWTSIRGHSQLLKDNTHGGSPRYALDLFRVLSEKADHLFVREVIKSADNSFGGMIYLLDHTFAEFLSECHQQNFDEKKADFSMVQNLIDVLEVVSLLLRSLENHTNTDLDYQIMLVHLWSRRAWFLKRLLPSIKLTDDQSNNIFEGARTVEDCLFAMDEVAKKLLTAESIDHHQLAKIYTLLVDSWVQSGLDQSEKNATNYLNKMEQDARVTEIDSRPYNSLLTLCIQEKNDERAIYLWNSIRAPESAVEPDYHTLGALLLTLVNTNRVDDAIKILRETEEVTSPLLTNTVCYNIVLSGLSKGGYREADKEALSLLQTMTELSEVGKNPQIAPDRVTMSIIMEILATQGVPASEIEDVLVKCQSHAMINPDLEPDCVMYNIVLAAYARQSTNRDQQSHSLAAPNRAKALLQTMVSNPRAQPNTTSYNSVLHAFVESDEIDLEQVLSFFEEMKAEAATGNGTIKPDTITYNIILSALSRDTTEKGMERAEAFLEEFKINGIEADTITFNTLLNSMVKCGNPKMFNHAERIIKKMEADFKSGRSAVKPDVRSYNAILNGYAKAGTVDASRRAEILLKEMEALAFDDENRADCRPDLVSYACVMDAYARSTVPDAGMRAEKIIKYMEQTSIEPNTICYNLAINCWAKSKHKDAPLRAENLLNKMQQEYESGNTLIKPNSISFTSVMNCWAQSSSDISPERATQIMHRMELLAKAGDKNMQANAYTYSTIISAWGRSGHSDAVEKSLAIINNVEANYSKRQSPTRVNFAMYNSAINAIAKSNRESKARDAASLLERMKRDFHEGGNPQAAPTPTSFSAVINACAHTTDPGGRAEAFQIARKTFRELLTKEYGEPTPACYVNFLSVCSRLMPLGTERDQLALSTIFDCSKRGLINQKVMQCFKNTASEKCYKYAIVNYNLERAGRKHTN